MVTWRQLPGGAHFGSAGPADHYAAVGRGDNQSVLRRHLALGIAEEVGHEGAERPEPGGPPVAPRKGQKRGRHERPRNERPSGFVDFHERRVRQKKRPDGLAGPATLSDLKRLVAGRGLRLREPGPAAAVFPQNRLHLIL